MNVTGLYENENMYAGTTLIELDVSEDIDDAADVFFNELFCEPYDEKHLWVWSQSPIEDTLNDKYFWINLSRDLADNGIDVPWQALQVEVELCLEEGNDPDFESRLD